MTHLLIKYEYIHSKCIFLHHKPDLVLQLEKN